MFFDDIVVFTDIHFGMKSNSRLHNSDCEDFIKWMIERAHARGIRRCIFMGDWHHNRAAINVSTLNYTTSCLGFLNEAFDQTYMIMGNHDLYYREKREIHSIPMADLYPNIKLINDGFFIEDGVALIPWLVDDEHKKLSKIKNVKYVFGHFELPNFFMNAMVQMPDHGHGAKDEDFKNFEKVFSGHFHKRQERNNIIYPGNCFPHNYADAWDDDRGIMFMKWDGTIEYEKWPDAPTYRTVPLSKLIDEPEKILQNKTNCRVTLDVNVTYEEANYIKETFSQQYNLREIALIPSKKEEHAQDWSAGQGEIEIENVDQIVLNQLGNIESDVMRNEMLIEIYNGLSR